MDASVGISIGSRRGLGRVKHIDTIFLWVQQVVTQGRVKIGKKPTDEMLADILTKPVSEELMEYMMRGMSYFMKRGSIDWPKVRLERLRSL